MPLTFTLDPVRKVVFTRGWGTVSIDDVQRSATEIRTHPDFHEDFAWLADLEEVTGTDATYQALSKFAKSGIGDPFSRRSHGAMFATNNFIFGFCRMYQTLQDDNEHFGVFRTREEAMRWLGLQ